jgi:hypothetical protein
LKKPYWKADFFCIGVLVVDREIRYRNDRLPLLRSYFFGWSYLRKEIWKSHLGLTRVDLSEGGC